MKFRNVAASIVFIATSLTCVPLSTPAQASLFDLKGDIKDIISHMKEAMSALIAQAGGETRLTLARTFQLANTMIDDLSAAYAGSLDKTFDKLDTQQRRAFEDARDLIDETQRAMKGTANDLIHTVADLNATINNVAVWSSRPLVTRYEPTFLAPVGTDANVHITMSGFKLLAPDIEHMPILSLNGKTIDARGNSDQSIDFVLDRADLPSDPTKITYVTAEVTLYHNTFWFPVVDWFVKTYEPIKYQLIFTALPEKLGVFSVDNVVSTSSTDRVFKKLIALPATAPGSGGGSGMPLNCWVPDEGYKFEVNTALAVTDVFYGSYRGQGNDPRYNHGYVRIPDDRKTEAEICLDVQANTGAKEDGAHTEGHLEVWESKPTTVVTNETVAEQPLTWSAETHVDMLPNAKQVIKVRIFDEMTYEIPITESRTIPFVALSPDTASMKTFLRPDQAWLPRWE